MITIDRPKSKWGVGHIVYEKGEADEQNLQYKHWKEAQKGEWCISDDGYVARVLDRRTYKTGEFIVLPYTRSFCGKSDKIHFLACQDKNNIGGKSWQQREVKRKRAVTTIKVAAMMHLTGTIDYEKLGQIYRPDQRIPAATVKRFLKQKEVQHMIKEEIAKQLVDSGITDQYVLDTIKDAIALAKTNKDPGNMLKGAVEAAKLRDMYPKDNKVIAQVEYQISPELLSKVEDATVLPAPPETKRLDPEAAIDAV